MREILGEEPGFRWETDYLGPVPDLGGLRRENRRLEAEVARLQAQERTYGDVLAENRRLRGALGMAERCGCRTVGASVVAGSGSSFQLSVTVDAGTRRVPILDRDTLLVRHPGEIGKRHGLRDYHALEDARRPGRNLTCRVEFHHRGGWSGGMRRVHRMTENTTRLHDPVHVVEGHVGCVGRRERC